MPGGRVAAGHGQRFGAGHRLGQRLRRRRPPASAARTLRKGVGQNARQVKLLFWPQSLVTCVFHHASVVAWNLVWPLEQVLSR